MLYIHEGEGVCDTIFGPLRYGPGDYLVLPIGTTWRLDPDEGSEQRILYLEAPSEIEPPDALSKRLRPAARALPVLTARHPRPRRRSGGRGTRRVRHPRAFSGSHHRLSLPPSPVRCRRLGRLPVAVPLQHRRLPADHRTGPPAAARASDVPGTEFRRVLVRAAQVRLPPAGDPGSLQPLEHQQRRGHLLRRRELHEPARGGDRLVHAPPRGDRPRPAPRHGRGVDRQGGDRGTGCDGRHVPPAQGDAGGDGPRRRQLPVHAGSRRRTTTPTSRS